MKKDIYFMPLGGGQNVGASCYYLKLGDNNIILDAGIGISQGMVYEPDMFSLLTSPFVESLSQLQHIYISHAHMDHVGYLLKLMKDAPKASVYMTEITALLSEYQLYDKNFQNNIACDEEKRLGAQSLLDNIVKVTYMKQIDFEKYKVTFFPAGHIPGAMMTLFEFGRKRILYTGDYSVTKTALTSECQIPEQNIDILIMCGLHAKHPEYLKNTSKLLKTVQYTLRVAEQRKKSVICHISQLSKGIEFLQTLNQCNTNNVPIYLDEQLMEIVQKMEHLSMPILTPNNRVMTENAPNERHIFLTSKKRYQKNVFYQEVNADFSLHDDFEDMKKFIKRINPKKAIIVHCAEEHSVFDETIEQELMYDGDCKTQFIFAEEKELYKL